jgi:hypothetical protein
MEIRQFIENETKGAKTQADLDQIWSSGFPQRIKAAFPDADASEIMYEWDSIKNKIKKMA